MQVRSPPLTQLAMFVKRYNDRFDSRHSVGIPYLTGHMKEAMASQLSHSEKSLGWQTRPFDQVMPLHCH